MTDWDDAYENSAYIDGAAAYPAQWASDAKSYREAVRNADFDIAYGTHAREKYGLFQPDGAPKGVMVFVHGGYWMKFDRTSWSHLAEGARARGWAVAVPSYGLTPQFQISEITRQIGAAIAHVAGRIGGPIRLAGHSAGGHLVARMLCEGGPLEAEDLRRIEHVMSISGLHDLRPLLLTKLNQTLRLSEAEAVRESPHLARPVAHARLTCWVGADERPEFVRQSQLMAQAWPATEVVEDAGHHHFSVIAGLTDPNSDIVNKLLG